MAPAGARTTNSELWRSKHVWRVAHHYSATTVHSSKSESRTWQVIVELPTVKLHNSFLHHVANVAMYRAISQPRFASGPNQFLGYDSEILKAVFLQTGS